MLHSALEIPKWRLLAFLMEEAGIPHIPCLEGTSAVAGIWGLTLIIKSFEDLKHVLVLIHRAWWSVFILVAFQSAGCLMEVGFLHGGGGGWNVCRPSAGALQHCCAPI